MLNYHPVAVEPSRVFGLEEKAAVYLIQQLSIAVQWGNPVSIVRSVGSQCCP